MSPRVGAVGADGEHDVGGRALDVHEHGAAEDAAHARHVNRGARVVDLAAGARLLEHGRRRRARAAPSEGAARTVTSGRPFGPTGGASERSGAAPEASGVVEIGLGAAVLRRDRDEVEAGAASRSGATAG